MSDLYAYSVGLPEPSVERSSRDIEIKHLE